MAKRKKTDFKTLHSRVPDVLSYTALVLLFVFAVVFVRKMVGVDFQ